MNALAHMARGAQRIVAFTGAGMSTESGIPDYRGPGGVWERNAPPTLADFVENEDTRREYWRERRIRYPALRETRPNSGHLALARLSDAGLLTTVITQNIDGLHQKSGIPPERVVELHGSAHQVRCLDCKTIYPADLIQERLEREPLPSCQNCGGALRAATILFGESLSATALRRAIDASRSCDLMLVVGSSLVVQPAARMPFIATASGANLAIVNNEPTPLDHLATLVVRASAGKTLTEFADALLAEAP
jgi:NAD-dependent deacetylase